MFDWDDGALDRRFALRPSAIGLAAGGPSFRETVARLELPAKSLVAGCLGAVLYVAPVLFIAKIFVGFGGPASAAVLATAALAGSLASWAITVWEQRREPREREHLSDHADPPPWR